MSYHCGCGLWYLWYKTRNSLVVSVKTNSKAKSGAVEGKSQNSLFFYSPFTSLQSRGDSETRSTTAKLILVPSKSGLALSPCRSSFSLRTFRTGWGRSMRCKLPRYRRCRTCLHRLRWARTPLSDCWKEMKWFLI